MPKYFILQKFCGVIWRFCYEFDSIIFRIGAIKPIRQDDIYGGFKVTLTALLDTIETPLSIDVSTGDIITPEPVKLILQGMLDEDKQTELWAYNIETVIAEKLETVLRRNILSTRPRDYYDLYILTSTQPYDPKLVNDAFMATAKHRGTIEQISDTKTLLDIISSNRDLQAMWSKYQKQFNYAATIEWDTVMRSLRNLCENLIFRD
jgi:predicted nucleotidyltransferase component of viral defense system